MQDGSVPFRTWSEYLAPASDVLDSVLYPPRMLKPSYSARQVYQSHRALATWMNVPSYRAYSSAEDKRNVVSFEAPPPVKGWPTPWLTQDEFNHYMLPLYEHNWRTTIETQKQIQAEGTQSTHALGTFLEKTFAFDDSRSCFAALQSIHELCEKEKVNICALNGLSSY